jgi:dihydroorotase
MNVLIRQATIADPRSVWNGQQADILIENGRIVQIGTGIETGNHKIIEEPNLVASPGFTDVFSHFGDPGLEFKEPWKPAQRQQKQGAIPGYWLCPIPNR